MMLHLSRLKCEGPTKTQWAAGVITTTDELWLGEALEGLRTALAAGQKILAGGGSALDAVTAAVVALEEDPHFNAGRGAVLTHSGRHELEASIMTSEPSGNCGAAALLTRVRNPVCLARAVMEHTPHVWLAGSAAEAFAQEQGLELVPDPSFFTTPKRVAMWEAYLAGGVKPTAVDAIDAAVRHTQTVGAVAVDAAGRLAAATSTGGRTGKMDGRIGDTPVHGAGTWADARVAVSGTGVGEEFMRRCACYDVAARVKYAGATLEEAVQGLVFRGLRPGDGGVISVSSDYSICMEFNTVGMFRGAADSEGLFEVGVFESLA